LGHLTRQKYRPVVPTVPEAQAARNT
jgi:hypothetical protein